MQIFLVLWNKNSFWGNLINGGIGAVEGAGDGIGAKIAKSGALEFAGKIGWEHEVL